MKSKKILSIILVLLILILIAGGAFAYAYIATDIFKTDQEMFFKYFAQITAEDGFIEKGIVDFEKKKMQIPYKNSGEITINLEGLGELDEKILEKVKGLVIRFDGQSDSVKQKVEQNIEIDYGNNVILPISYKQDGNKLGLQSDKLSKQYIGIRNEKLKEFATKFGIEDLSEIPDKIELSNVEEETIFTDEEIEQIKQTYGTVLQEQLVEENFTSVKTQQNESYTLELSAEQIKNIIIKMLEATKSNTMIIDKINELILEQDPEIEKIDVAVIDDLIKSINEEDISEIPNFRITIVQTNKQLEQIMLQLGENQIIIQKSNIQNSITYNINCEIKDESRNSFSLIEEEAETTQINIYFKSQYTGLETLSNVQERYQFGFSGSEGETKVGYDYTVNTNTQFDESISITSLDKSNTVFLNDYDKEQVTKFLSQVGTKLLEINKNQMTQLGLKEYENPILYSNPIMTLFGLYYNIKDEHDDDGKYFTVNVDSENEIAIFENLENKVFEKKLKSSDIEFFSDISVKWLPEDIDNERDGSHNGRNYIAYTFYAENIGKETINYWTAIEIDDVIKNVDEAVRVMVFKNGQKVIYAKNNRTTQQPEPETVPFYDEDTVMLELTENFKTGDIDKYTVVIWIEGNDTDAVDERIGGTIKMHMDLKKENILQEE